MTIDAVPLKLHKANLELQMQICRLVQEEGSHWLQLASRASADSVAGAKAEIEELRKSDSWQSLMTGPGELFWRQLQQRIGDTQELTQLAIKNQAAFNSGLQEAIQSWRKVVNEAVGDPSAMQPVQDFLKPWSGLWPAPGTKVPEKTGKGA